MNHGIGSPEIRRQISGLIFTKTHIDKAQRQSNEQRTCNKYCSNNIHNPVNNIHVAKSNNARDKGKTEHKTHGDSKYVISEFMMLRKRACKEEIVTQRGP